MKKIIRNRRYDTGTAKLIGEWENTGDVRDHHRYCETLYKKRTGEYFIYGAGNAASKYAQSVGNNCWSGGDTIIPLSYESARQWAEDHMDADDYESEFGEVSEGGGGDVMISIRVTPAARAALDRASAQTGRSKGEILSELLTSL